jgi:hypothetical protein
MNNKKAIPKCLSGVYFSYLKNIHTTRSFSSASAAKVSYHEERIVIY